MRAYDTVSYNYQLLRDNKLKSVDGGIGWVKVIIISLVGYAVVFYVCFRVFAYFFFKNADREDV